jgi:hypothetical protein
MLRWATGGPVTAGSVDIEMVRLIILTSLPQVGGLLLMLAGALWRLRRS